MADTENVPEDFATLFVTGLPSDDTEIRKIFDECGTISQIRLLPQKDDQTSRAGIIIMSSGAEAREAMHALKGKRVESTERPLRLTWDSRALDRRLGISTGSSGGGGGYGKTGGGGGYGSSNGFGSNNSGGGFGSSNNGGGGFGSSNNGGGFGSNHGGGGSNNDGGGNGSGGGFGRYDGSNTSVRNDGDDRRNFFSGGGDTASSSVPFRRRGFISSGGGGTGTSGGGEASAKTSETGGSEGSVRTRMNSPERSPSVRHSAVSQQKEVDLQRQKDTDSERQKELEEREVGRQKELEDLHSLRQKDFDELEFLRHKLEELESAPQKELDSAKAYLANMATLYGSKERSDFTFTSSDDQDYPAHQAILIAQCPAFAVMLRADGPERETGRCHISSVDGETLDTMLNYLYSLTIPDFDAVDLQKVENLLVAADKYQLAALKTACEEFLQKNVNLNNAAGLLILGNLHSAAQLKLEAMRCIKKDLHTFVKNGGLKGTIRPGNEWVEELLLFCSDDKVVEEEVLDNASTVYSLE